MGVPEQGPQGSPLSCSRQESLAVLPGPLPPAVAPGVLSSGCHGESLCHLPRSTSKKLAPLAQSQHGVFPEGGRGFWGIRVFLAFSADGMLLPGHTEMSGLLLLGTGLLRVGAFCTSFEEVKHSPGAVVRVVLLEQRAARNMGLLPGQAAAAAPASEPARGRWTLSIPGDWFQEHSLSPSRYQNLPRLQSLV